MDWKLPRAWRIGVLFGILATGPGSAPPPAAAATGYGSPRLILFVTVDQLRYDYLERLRDRFSGGFARLMRDGVYFERAHHAHAVTTTGPGHASLATGVYPSRSGIIDNQWYDRGAGAVVNCVEDTAASGLDAALPGRSPKNLLADTVADWIKIADGDAKVFGVSRKDRGAILPAGHRADGAYWYDLDTGRFVSSSHYRERYPDWMLQFAEALAPERYFGRAWEPLPVSRELIRRAGFEGLDSGVFQDGFPRVLGGLSLLPDRRFFSDFGGSPLMDRYLVEFVKALAVGEELGRDDSLDFLGVSFSALDSVGHEFGPNSPEVLDTLLRLDRSLGDLLQFLDRHVGEDRFVVTLSADHGVVPLPEYRAVRRLAGERLSTPDILCFQHAGGVLNRKYGDQPWVLAGLYLNYEVIGRLNLLRSEVESTLARELESCRAVRRVWTRTELAAQGSATEDAYRQLYRHSFHPERSADLMVQWQEYWLAYGGRGTSHGSPYDYDRHVPLMIALPGVAARRVDTPVETVDLAPTLCTLLGLVCPETLDGRDRSEELK